MRKTIDELRPSDRVIVRLGAKTQRNEVTGNDDVIDPQKDIDVAYAYWLAVIDNSDEYYAATSFYRPIGRTVHLVGLAGYVDKKDDTGNSYQEISTIPFETEDGREQARRQAQADEKRRINAELRQAEELEQERIQAAQEAELQRKQAEAAHRGALLNAQNAVKKANDALKKASDKLAEDLGNTDQQQAVAQAQQVADEAAATLAVLKNA